MYEQLVVLADFAVLYSKRYMCLYITFYLPIVAEYVLPVAHARASFYPILFGSCVPRKIF
uniref:Uncharacterized protein n=1 Tax=Arundo donax TaxID=35708 RepID=A0A0A9HEE3_ARUDO